MATWPTDAARRGGGWGNGGPVGTQRPRGLAQNDSYPFFAELGDLVITGSTGTNVMDLHVMLVG